MVVKVKLIMLFAPLPPVPAGTSSGVSGTTQTSGATYSKEEALKIIKNPDAGAFLNLTPEKQEEVQKAFTYYEEFDANQVVFTSSTLTVSNLNQSKTNQYQYTVIELLQDCGVVKKGTMISVVSSNNNTLVFDTVANLSGSCPVKISQIGLFPRIADETSYGKSIPIQVIEAVSWQAVSLKSESETVSDAVKSSQNKATLKSESIGQSYSYTKKDKTSVEDLICEQSKVILDSLTH